VIVTHDPDSETLGNVHQIWVDGTQRTIVEARATHRGWLVALEGVTTRTEAEALRGQSVEVDRELLELGEGDVLLHDLVGCRVVLRDGSPWGTIFAIEADGQDRLVIHDGGVERLLPLVDAFVKTIDLDAGVVIVDPPAGLPEHRIAR
jgi:16S rRNA processing protein RimM